MAQTLVVVSKVKDEAKMRVSREAIDAISDAVRKVVKTAAERAKNEGRETIKAKHVEAVFSILQDES
jgi:histone H3/H4